MRLRVHGEKVEPSNSAHNLSKKMPTEKSPASAQFQQQIQQETVWQ